MPPVTYAVENQELVTPDDPREQLHDYHDKISTLVNADVYGITGQGPQIRRIVLSEETDVSDLEDFLNSSIYKYEPEV